MTRTPHPLDRLVAPLTVVKADTWRECNSSTCAVHWRVTLMNDIGKTYTQEGVQGRTPTHKTEWFEFWKAVAISLSQIRATLLAEPIVDTITRPTILRTISYATGAKSWWKEDLRKVLEYQHAEPEFIDRLLSVDVGVFAEVQRLCNLRLYANPD